MSFGALETQLFSYQCCDDDGNGDWTFHLCSLKVPIGSFPAGSNFESIIWDGKRSLIVLVDDNSDEFIFELKVVVGKQLDHDSVHDTHGEGCGCDRSKSLF
jgi:hypothetical protein